jgi:small subunit ribosomal protein S11
MATTRKTSKKKRKVQVEPEGLAYIKASFNNMIITITNKQGQVVSWSSAGKSGFRGSKKNTPYAAQVAAGDAAQSAHDSGMRSVEVFVRGPGSGREAAIRAIDGAGIKVTKIQDVTPIPHNGCRPPKRRRV